MDPTYTDQLEAIVAKLPEESCVLGLIAAPDADWALAAAGDFAATVSRARQGHTILVSVASDRPDLDHELGVESELGLSDVLTGAASMKSVAARSRGRGYIYVPQGASPLSARSVLESRAWRRIRDSALARGATLLVLLAPDALRLELDLGLAGLVLLGVAAGDVTREEDPALPPVLGTLEPPAATGAPDSAAGSPDSAAASAASTRWSRRPRSGRSERIPSLRHRGSMRVKGGEDSKSRRPIKAPFIAAFVIVALLAVIALVIAAATGASDRVPFPEQDDSLWQRPVPSFSTGDSAGAPFDSSATPPP